VAHSNFVIYKRDPSCINLQEMALNFLSFWLQDNGSLDRDDEVTV
jgi:hypothetical protein